MPQRKTIAPVAPPKSAYVLFIKDAMSKGADGKSKINSLAEASKVWNDMEAEEKAKYQTTAQLQKEQY